MKFLVFDCETTGLPDFKKPADDPCQPRMIQLAALLFGDRAIDETGEEIPDMPGFVLHGAFVKPVKPDGWTMPAELAEKLGHGLTHDHLEAHGRPVAEALDAFCLLQDQTDFMVAYGVSFDLKILRGELRRAGRDDRYGTKPDFCVMRACTPICKMPPTDAMMATGRKSFKTPKLGEAVEIIFGETLRNAHDAHADCLATARLLRHLIKIGAGPKAIPAAAAE